jgi:hypothetical protein
MLKGRSLPSLLAIYFIIIGMPLACAAIGLALMVQASAGLPQQAEREKTLLDLRVESSREIRQALAKPIPPPEPLPPLTARAAQALGGALAAKPQRKLGKEARDAFASSEWSAQSHSTVTHDRHTSNY